MWGGERAKPEPCRRNHWQLKSALVLSLAMCTTGHTAGTERPPETFAVSIDRQPLDLALQQLARQCSVQLIFFSRVTEGINAPAISGDYTVAAAMERLLAGSGLTFRLIDSRTVEVSPPQARAAERSRPANSKPNPIQELPGETPAGPLEEVVVVGLVEQLVATRIATPLREIPQTVSIVTREQMRQRNDAVLGDVLAHAAGVSTSRSTSFDQDFYARGFPITSFHIDGGAALNPQLDANSNQLFLGTPDLIEFDHVEILRGADGLFGGNGDPGGTVSLVRKRPQRQFAFNFSATTGSWDRQRVELDLTGPLTQSGTLRGRAAAVYAHEGYFYDVDAHERRKVFGALEYDFSESSTVTAGVSYQWDKAAGMIYGLPLYADGRNSRLPRETGLDFDWTRYRSELSGAYVQYRQRLGPGWAVKFNASGWRTEAEFAYGVFDTLIDPRTGEVDAPGGVFSDKPNVHTQKTADLTLTGTLDWFGWREEVAVGGDFTRVDIHTDNFAYYYVGEPTSDLRDFDPSLYPDPRLGAPYDYKIRGSSSQDQYGVFASLRVYFNDAMSIVGGARLSNDSKDTRIVAQVGPIEQTVSGSRGTDDVLTPYAGVVYAFDPHYSLFVSYAEIYLTQVTGPERSPGRPLEPLLGANVEAGIKGEWRNGALNGTLALYRIDQRNNPRRVSSTADEPDASACCFKGVTSHSRGVDVEINGELVPGWTIGAGYSYNENESPEGEPLSTLTPKHMFKAWTNRRLPAPLHRWQVGGGVHAQSETTSRASYCSRFGCDPVMAAQPGYTVLDLRVGFDVDRYWRVALSLNNLFDKVYYESIDTPALHAWYGEPRNWTLRFDGRF